MIPLSLAEVADLTGGRVWASDALRRQGVTDPGRTVVDGSVVTDSRQVWPAGLYVARIGEHADGHDYVGHAHERGAVAALTSRPVDEVPCVVVPDVQAAFGRLARGVLQRARDLTVVAVTGSSGKTSTKDLLWHVLRRHGPTVAARESLNGEVGVPLTVCRITTDTRFLVLEMGARGIGHLRYLTEIAPPDIAVVLNVGAAHVGEFGSRENTARAKAELVQAIGPHGVAVLNADDPVVAAMATQCGRAVLVGESAQAQVRAADVSLDASGRPSFRVVTPGGGVAVSLALHGRHHVGNALAVVAVALECGMPLADIAAALAGARPASRWRMEVTERADGVTIVNDAYNANPDSMAAALHALVAMRTAADGSTRRTWAVLGEMLELGQDAQLEHEGVGALAARLGVSRLVAVGAGARGIEAGARAAATGTQVSWLPDVDTAYEYLQQHCRHGDVVLLKSSRDSGLRWLGDRLSGALGGRPSDTEAAT
ncbi:MAG: UDP-N-acetylmuramoyl-tripeptide--D-alanyl-D-alanine ligase [Dermatophilaceae bacterium]